jgi:hypothetical protein
MTDIRTSGLCLFLGAILIYVAWLVLLAPGRPVYEVFRQIEIQDAQAAYISIPDLSTLPGLPRTEHARTGHKDQLWNVDNIVPKLSERTCRPIIAWSCPQEAKLICQVEPVTMLYVGLIVGDRTYPEGAIVTGYAAPLSYWEAAAIRDGCVGPVIIVP